MCAKSFSCARLFVNPWGVSHLCPWNAPGKNIGMGCHSLLQGIFLTQASNRVSCIGRQILYCLGHQGSPSFEESQTNQNESTSCQSFDMLERTSGRMSLKYVGDCLKHVRSVLKSSGLVLSPLGGISI